MPITINPATKRFVLDSTAATAKAIYAAWVDWVAVGDNAKYLPAFRTAGGDDLGGGLSIPPYYFLQNGWRVRPMEANQTLVIDGNLFVDGGGDPVVATLGVFQVLVKSVVPVQAQGISTAGGSAGPTASEVAVAVWQRAIEGGMTAEQIQRAMLAVLAGATTGAGTSRMTFKSLDGTTDRVAADVPLPGQVGNRSNVTVNGA